MVFSSGFTLESAEKLKKKKKKAGIKIFGGRGGGIYFKASRDCFRTKVLRIPLASESPGGIL